MDPNLSLSIVSLVMMLTTSQRSTKAFGILALLTETFIIGLPGSRYL